MNWKKGQMLCTSLLTTECFGYAKNDQIGLKYAYQNADIIQNRTVKS